MTAMSVCAICAKVCHAGHLIEYDGEHDFKCDCPSVSCQTKNIQWFPRIVRNTTEDAGAADLQVVEEEDVELKELIL